MKLRCSPPLLSPYSFLSPCPPNTTGDRASLCCTVPKHYMAPMGSMSTVVVAKAGVASSLGWITLASGGFCSHSLHRAGLS